jgi:hypothetical protein
MREDDQSVDPPLDPPPAEDGFEVQGELASDQAPDPAEGFEIERIIETRLDDDPAGNPEEGFETGYEIRSLESRSAWGPGEKIPPPPEEGFEEERET